MLREFVEQKHYKFAAEAPDWKEAIRMSCESLEADGTIEGKIIKEDIVACVEKYGPILCLCQTLPCPILRRGLKGYIRPALVL